MCKRIEVMIFIHILVRLVYNTFVRGKVPKIGKTSQILPIGNFDLVESPSPPRYVQGPRDAQDPLIVSGRGPDCRGDRLSFDDDGIGEDHETK